MANITKATGRAIMAQPAERLHELVEVFLSAQDVAPSSKATYRKQLRQFMRWLEETGRLSRMSQLSRRDILAYKEHLATDKSSHTVSGYLVPVRRLFAWLESEKLFPNIARSIKGAKSPRTFSKDSLTPGQIREALQSIDTSSLEGLRDYALFNLLVRTGLRSIEVARAQIKDIRQESGEAVLWIQGKGRDDKDNFVLLLDDTLQPLRQYLARRLQEDMSRAEIRDHAGALQEEAPLFASLSDRNYGRELTTRSIRRVIRRVLQTVNYGSSRISTHSLRHTAVTLAIKGGASLHQAQAMARHSDPKTTMIYFHNLDRVKQGAERCISF